MMDINDYTSEVSCTYKGETYLVRDNGAIYRKPKTKRRRELDSYWTFGTKNKNNGYMFFGSTIRVHQVVATAFHGEPAEKDMVVDHIDTNRCNNRPENLRWVTRLENVLNNPITRQKIIHLCGSIEAFLENPSILRESVVEPNFSWMRTVSPEEAKNCKKNLERWLSEDKSLAKGEKTSTGFSESIFSYTYNKTIQNRQKNQYQIYDDIELEEIEQKIYTPSHTPSALQRFWNTPATFPKCPSEVTNLESYLQNLKVGEVFSESVYGTSLVIEAGITKDGKELYVGSHNPNNNIKPWGLTCIYIDEEHYIHESRHTFFTEQAVKNEINVALGKDEPWIETIDDLAN